MLDSEYLPGFSEVEHIEDDGFITAVLASMDRTNDLDQRFAFMERTFLAVLADNSQFALLHDAVVNGRVMMPTGNGTYGERHAQYG